MKDFKFEQGKSVTDLISGFSGVVTGRADYLTGCNQYLILPPIGDDFKYPEATWFDESRLKEDKGNSVKIPSNKVHNDGPCGTAPIK